MVDQPSEEYHCCGEKKLCVIFSQVAYEDYKKRRYGNEYEGENLQKFFENIGFMVILQQNSTEDKFRELLEGVKRKCKEDSIELLVMFVLGHGANEMIETIDGVDFPINNIISPFKGETLRGKPKLFFFQTCRGANYELGLNVECTEGECIVPFGCTEPDEFDINKLSLDADILVAHSTIPGCVSFNTRDLGSPFIFFLHQVFIKHSSDLDILSMLTIVNRLIANKLMGQTKEPEQLFMQVGSFKSFLRKKLFLTKTKCTIKCGPLYVKNGKKPRYVSNQDDKLYSLAAELKLTEEDVNLKPIEKPSNKISGLCLIFNPFEERVGSKKDVKNLMDLFRDTLGFSVSAYPIIHKNANKQTLTKETILDILTEVTSNKVLMSQITHLVLFILTHAENSEMCCANGESLSVEDLLTPLKNSNEIRRIPKLLFVQADGLNLYDSHEFKNKKMNKENQSIAMVSPTGRHLPSEANFLFAYSNFKAKKQNDGEEEESLFVHFFCETVRKYSNKQDLISILTFVNFLLNRELTRDSVEELNDGKEMVFFISQLTDNVFLGENPFDN